MPGLIISAILLAVCLTALFYFFQGPFFVPTLSKTVAQMVLVAKLKPGSKTVDLGSGDGRVVIAFAKVGAQATGFELNPLLVWYSRWKIKRARLSDSAQILTTNFWSQDFSEYDCLTVFGINYIMDRLGKKLAAELKPGAIVISNAFKIPGLTQIDKKASLIVYQK